MSVEELDCFSMGDTAHTVLEGIKTLRGDYNLFKVMHLDIIFTLSLEPKNSLRWLFALSFK